MHLLPLMLERMGIIFIVAFLLSRLKSFQRIINNDQRISGKLLLIVVFGIFGIMSNYTGGTWLQRVKRNIIHYHADFRDYYYGCSR